MEYKTYDAILQNGETIEEAIEYAKGMVWSECQSFTETISHARHIDTIEGVGVYYDYGADYYFFTDETE